MKFILKIKNASDSNFETSFKVNAMLFVLSQKK